MSHVRVSTLLALVLVLSALAPAATGHTGYGCGLSGTGAAPRLEGECYDAPVPCNEVGCSFSCDPDPDAEHTYVRTGVWGASGSATAFSPHAQCGWIYDGIAFSPSSPLVGATYTYQWTGITYQCSGTAGTSYYSVTVYVDYQYSFFRDFYCNSYAGLQTLTIAGAPAISKGTHRIDFYFNSGGWTNNFELDYMQFSCTGSLLGVAVAC
ncbi:MAG TPA: hypothetical protein VNX21_04200 [Candidatus Thermoplasmatota archaeon]|nr:hypothetical protein [Candidatus Thermoplasmatota archaeon]